MKKFPYSNERIMQIFVQLHKRKLAMFLGYLTTGEPAIWMTHESGLSRAPISIATADMLLDEILSRELENAFRTVPAELLIGEILEPQMVRIVKRNSVGRPRRSREVVLRDLLLPAVAISGN